MSYLREFGTWIVGGIGSMYAFATGNFDVATLVLGGLMLIDIFSGLLKGGKHRNLQSYIMSLGIIKKGGIILSILFAFLLDTAVNGGQPVFRTMMTWVAIGNESLSISENLKAVGVTVPSFVMERIGQVKDSYLKAHVDKDTTVNNKEDGK